MADNLSALAALRRGIGELVEHRESRRALAEFSRYADDPVGFARDVLGVTLTAQQARLIAAVQTHPLVSAAGSVGTGKDWCGAVLALWWAIARQGLVLTTSATQLQAIRIGFGYISRLFRGATDLPGDLFAESLRIDPDSGAGILAFVSSSTDASRWTGFHHPRVLVLVSEAQGVADAAIEGALSCASSSESRVVLLGNPLHATGAFRETERQPHWHFVRLPASEHPNLIEGRDVVPGAVTRQQVATLIAQFGEDSAIVQARVHARFPVDDPDAQLLVRREWVDRAVARFATAPPVTPFDVWTAGLDVARMGNDASVLALRTGDVVRELIAWRGLTTDASADRVVGELRARGRPLVNDHWDVAGRKVRRIDLFGDSTGVGAGVMDGLRRLGAKTAVDFVAAGQATDPARFANRRSEVAWIARTWLEDDRLAIPPVPDLIEDLCALRWKLDPRGRTLLEPKDDFRRRVGRSSDAIDPVTYSLANERLSRHGAWGRGSWSG